MQVLNHYIDCWTTILLNHYIVNLKLILYNTLIDWNSNKNLKKTPLISMLIQPIDII